MGKGRTMKWTITAATNFVRLFVVPDEFSPEYCFGGGHDTNFVLIDWFNPFDQQIFWETEKLELLATGPRYTKHIKQLKACIQGKRYFNDHSTFMAMTDYGDVFLINPERRSDMLNSEMKRLREAYKKGRTDKD